MNQKSTTWVCGLLLTLWLLSPGAAGSWAAPAAATVRYVAPGANCGVGNTPCYGSLQAAVNAAVSGDVIRVAVGTYTDAQADPGSGTPTLVYVLKTVILQGGWNSTFTSRNPAAYPTILDGEGRGPVVYVSGASAAPTIEGFVITGGNGSSVRVSCGWPWVTGCGGGIFVSEAMPLIAHNVITNNVGSGESGTGWGGGIHVANGGAGLQIRNNTIISNSASSIESGMGGGIALFNCAGTPEITANRIEGNSAGVVSGLGGGWAATMARRSWPGT